MEAKQKYCSSPLLNKWVFSQK
jgi:hypothetical protein